MARSREPPMTGDDVAVGSNENWIRKSECLDAAGDLRDLRVTTRLIREWRGVEHSVTVRQEDFEYQGRPYKSLSAIARAITGTRWNGLVFFGLKNKRGH